jgi:hypothetical protein
MGEKKSADLEFRELAEEEAPNSPANSQNEQEDAARGKKKKKKDGENQSNVSNYIVRCTLCDGHADWNSES